MAFGLRNVTGEFTPIVKYNAKAGRLYRVDKTNTGSGWETNEVDISQNFSGIFDFANIEVGYVYFGPTGPQWVMSNYGQGEPTPAQPGDKDDDGKLLFKGGFRVKLLLSTACGGGVRELAATANSIVQALGAVYEEYVAAPQKAQGKLPVVKLASVIPEKGGFGTNYRPVWEIVSWVDRPEKLTSGLETPVMAAPALAKSTPPATGKKPVSAPAAWDEDDIPPPVRKGVASQFKAAVEADADGDFG